MELDDAYANAPYIQGAEGYPQAWEAAADTYRAQRAAVGKARLGMMYGHGVREALDLFLPDGIPEGLVVFVHGGYWLRFGREHWSHLAEGARAAGWAVAMPSYDLCPRVRVGDIVRQVAQAVTVAAHEVQGPVRLTGHSAGGLLAARLSMPGLLPEDVARRLAHVMPISPVADLRPLMRTSMNADLRIDAAEAVRESPALHPAPQVRVSVWIGQDERPAFLEQAQALSQAWAARLAVVPGRHHFDIVDPLADPGSDMVADLLG